MSVPERLIWLGACLLVTATLLCAGSPPVQAAPASKTAKPQNLPAQTITKFPTKPSSANAGKSPTTGAANAPKQDMSPSRTIEKKTGESAPGNLDAWPPPPASHQLTPESPVDTSSPPPSLPRASRMRMRACAEEWTRKKLLTRSNLPRWRDFATACLSQKTKS
jgi:hypothetical protein